MKQEELQWQIDHADGPKDMITVALAYLDGDVLHDDTAAEAWLMRAIDAEHPTLSVEAMGILAQRVLKKDVVSDAEADEIQARLQSAQGEEKSLLTALNAWILKKTEQS